MSKIDKQNKTYFRPTPQQFYEFVHEWTERMAIKVIIDIANFDTTQPGLKRLSDFYLTTDLKKDKERIFKYYGDAPLWNLHVDWRSAHTVGDFYRGMTYTLVANVHFSDIMEGYLKEKEDIKKDKRKKKGRIK